MTRRPENEAELQKREADGVIRASRFVRELAKSPEPITLKNICAVHREIFREAWPEIAGVYRVEDLNITDSDLLLPHHTEVEGLMLVFGRELDIRFVKLKSIAVIFLVTTEPTEDELYRLDEIVESSAWAHHQITKIHPFREGNGRTARLLANLILQKYGLMGISVKIERENKNRYRSALAHADKTSDLEQLKSLIYDGLFDRFNGDPMKYVKG